MANREHLEILRQGVEVWNEWRAAHPEVRLDLRRANLSNEHLRHANLRFADLSHTTLLGANLSYATLLGANLIRANLDGAKLINANLRYADLSDAKLIGAILRYTELSDAKLIGAILRSANFSRAILSDADFTGANLAYTSFVDNDLSQVKGLEAVKHLGPSSIGIDTIYKSRGEIPEVFLRGCGVPEDFITYMRSLTVQPIQFYTCFISFTEADDAFSERLYNDMQGKGVRCWRWKEDAKLGKTLMRSIDEAVRLYDKLIIICSEQSLNSPAVIREIERALQKEDELARQGKEGEVLFPIRLDDYVFTGWDHHRKADVTAKNVGDFRRWKDHDSYQKVFARLLRDLKAGKSA